MRSFTRALTVLTVLVTVLAASPSSAKGRPAKPPAADPLAKMLAEGWRVVADGVLQRQKGPTKVETFAFGAEGFAWAAARLEEKLAFFRAEQEQYPSGELATLIEAQEAELTRLQASIENARLSGESGRAGLKAAVGCNFCYGGQADAYHLTASQGVGASASANFSNGCGNAGNTRAYAYARAGTAAPIVQDVLKTGTGINSAAAATATGSTNCYSEAWAEVQSDALSYYYSIAETNSDCPTPPGPTVTISGTSWVYLTGNQTQNAFWSASVSGGTPPYTYQWKWNGSNVGTNSTSFSGTYYGSNTYASWTDTVSVVVTDSRGQQGTDSHTIQVTQEPGSTNCDSRWEICPVQ